MHGHFPLVGWEAYNEESQIQDLYMQFLLCKWRIMKWWDWVMFYINFPSWLVIRVLWSILLSHYWALSWFWDVVCDQMKYNYNQLQHCDEDELSKRQCRWEQREICSYKLNELCNLNSCDALQLDAVRSEIFHFVISLHAHLAHIESYSRM